MEFFLPMIPPTATHQEKKWRVVKGKPVSYDPPEVLAARWIEKRHCVSRAARASNAAVQRKFGVCMATVLNWRRQMEKGSDQNA